MDVIVVGGALAATLGACLAVGWSAYLHENPARSAADRLAEIGRAAEAVRAGAPWSEEVGRAARTAAKLAAPTGPSLARVRQTLLQAGYRDRSAVERYAAARTVGTVLLGGVGALLAAGAPPLHAIGAALLGASAGYYLPALLVTNRRQKRQARLLRAFPDSLDLLVSCVEAGLALDAALRRVADEVEASAPELARELQLVTLEVNAGVPRAEALRHLAERVGLDDVTALVNVLIQADRFGTSVGRALRVRAEQVRVKRMQRAEELAAQVSPKLTVAIIVFILPCLLTLLMGPAFVNVRNLLLPTMGGG